MRRSITVPIGLLICAFTLAGCFSQRPRPTPTPPFGAQPVVEGTGTLPAFPTLPPEQGGTPIAQLPSLTPVPLVAPETPTPSRVDVFPSTSVPIPAQVPPTRIWISPVVPVELSLAVYPLIQSGRFVSVPSSDQAQVSLVSLGATGTSALMSRWIYVPVVRFNSVADALTSQELVRYWRGETTALSRLTDMNTPPALVTTPTVLFWLTQLLQPASKNVIIETVDQDAISQTMYQRPAAWGMIPFHKLDPTLKALSFDGLNALDRTLSNERYSLAENFGLVGAVPEDVNNAAAAIQATGRWQPSNRDVTKMTALIMTGVTALTRATAWKMETGGITTPMRDIAPFLATGDIIHTSNEVSFAKDCPYPNPASTALTFCSRESYFELLRVMGLNVVELTGNHNVDWGVAAANNSLDIYNQWQIPYFGGGRNIDDARKAAILRHNGNTIAFIGCNPVGPTYAWATRDKPGAAPCDDTFLSEEIPRLRKVTDVVIMTLQYQEYYQYSAPPVQQAFFRKYARMGANIVIGSQAHQPQGFAFVDGAFIHYGPGNLFFDQMDSIATRQMFMDKFIIYAGKHISTQLFTGIIMDYSRPRPMTEAERAAFLRTMFKASGW